MARNKIIRPGVRPAPAGPPPPIRASLVRFRAEVPMPGDKAGGTIQCVAGMGLKIFVLPPSQTVVLQNSKGIRAVPFANVRFWDPEDECSEVVPSEDTTGVQAPEDGDVHPPPADATTK